MPTAVNGQLFYSQDEVQAGLPQYHAALRQATGYTGQFSADPTQKFQQYISGATPEQQAAYNALLEPQSMDYWFWFLRARWDQRPVVPGPTTVVQTGYGSAAATSALGKPASTWNNIFLPIQTGITGLGTLVSRVL
jgi:hypothetical protein